MLADLYNLPDPDVMAEEIAENLESALGSLTPLLVFLKAIVWMLHQQFQSTAFAIKEIHSVA